MAATVIVALGNILSREPEVMSLSPNHDEVAGEMIYIGADNRVSLIGWEPDDFRKLASLCEAAAVRIETREVTAPDTVVANEDETHALPLRTYADGYVAAMEADEYVGG